MADKKISELQLISEFLATCSVPTDDGVQTYRTTGLQIAQYVAAYHASIANKEIGKISDFYTPDVPADYFECDGSAKSRTTYAALFAAITKDKGAVTISIATPGVVTLNGHGMKTGDIIELTSTGALPTGLAVNTNYYCIYNDANTFWLATTLANANAGTKIATSGTQSGVHSMRFCPAGISTAANFLLPDFRGLFSRASGASGLFTDANAAYYDGKNVGCYQQDQFQGHRHEALLRNDTGKTANSSANILSTGGGAEYTSTSGNAIDDAAANATNGASRYGTETRPAAMSVKRCIKYQ